MTVSCKINWHLYSLTFKNQFPKVSLLGHTNTQRDRQTDTHTHTHTHTHTQRRGGESCSVMSDSLRHHGLYSPCNSPGQNTGVGSLSLLQGIFPAQGLNPGLPHCRRILYQLSHQGSPSTGEVGGEDLITHTATRWRQSAMGHKA